LLLQQGLAVLMVLRQFLVLASVFISLSPHSFKVVGGLYQKIAHISEACFQ
jgi:hypothetical protein